MSSNASGNTLAAKANVLSIHEFDMSRNGPNLSLNNKGDSVVFQIKQLPD
jgi:hypothetical protein